jgi:hypothetical protein
VIDHWIIIFSGLKENDAIIYYALMSLNGYEYTSIGEKTGIGYPYNYENENVRHATNNEIQMLLEKLYKRGVKWDFENKQIVEIDR